MANFASFYSRKVKIFTKIRSREKRPYYEPNSRIWTDKKLGGDNEIQEQNIKSLESGFLFPLQSDYRKLVKSGTQIFQRNA